MFLTSRFKVWRDQWLQEKHDLGARRDLYRVTNTVTPGFGL